MHVGVIGSGMIVRPALAAMASTESMRAVALYHRPHSADVGRALCADFGITARYDDLTAFLADDTFDTVYVAVVTSAHFEMSKAALLAGKHVICEKPLTTTAAEARELVDLAAEHGLKFFEAIIPRYNPALASVRDSLASLGPVRVVRANYSQFSSRYRAFLAGTVKPAFDPALSGGALYDINVYNVHLCVELFGPPAAVAYYPNLGPNGIDTSGVLLCTYPGFVAALTGAKDSASPGGLVIQGEEGVLCTGTLPHELSGVTVRRGDQVIEVVRPADPVDLTGALAGEFAAIARIARSGDGDLIAAMAQRSVQVMTVLEEARRFAGIRFGPDPT